MKHYIKEWRNYRGLSLRKLADRIGADSEGQPLLSHASISRIERDIQTYTRDTLNLLANALHCAPSQLLNESPELGVSPLAPQKRNLVPFISSGETEATLEPVPGINRKVAVEGELQAGAWHEADDGSQLEGEYVQVPDDTRFPQFKYAAFRVRGPSMNRIMPDGCTVVCVSFIDLGRDPVDGEYVVVQRIKRSGLIEATVKRFVVENGRAVLRPESHDPRYQESLSLDGGPDDEEIRITARVIDVINKV